MVKSRPELRRALNALLRDAPLVYVDCGARAGRMPRPLRALKESQYIGFEADADECARLNALSHPRHRYLCAMLGRTREQRTFHLTRDPACASLLAPNHALLGEFGRLGEQFVVDRRLEIETTALEGCLAGHGIEHVDVVKLDTQGTELDILAGAERLLRETVVAVQVEVEFSPIYVDQPLFADVDAFLRDRGFHLYDLSRYHVRRSSIEPSVPTRGQLLWGHALYLRDHRALGDRLQPRLATVALLLDFPDVAALILDRLSGSASDRRVREAAERVRAAMRARPRLVPWLQMRIDAIRTSLSDHLGRGSTRTGVAIWRD